VPLQQQTGGWANVDLLEPEFTGSNKSTLAFEHWKKLRQSFPSTDNAGFFNNRPGGRANVDSFELVNGISVDWFQ
jgi:hypothetical protein